MRASFNINFYCRESKQDKKGYAHIELGITVNGQRLFLNTPMKVLVSDFNKKKQPTYIVEYTSLMREKVNSIINDLIRSGMPLTAHNIREYIKSGGVKSYTVGKMIEEFLQLIEKRSDMAQEQKHKYHLTADMLLTYVSKDDEMVVLTPALMTTIYTDLRKKYKDGTASGYMTRLKGFIRYAMDNNHLSINPFSTVKIHKPKTKVEILADSELQKIQSKCLENERLARVRDLFLFACGSGISYADICSLSPQDFKNVDGNMVVMKERKKTSVQFTSVLFPFAAEIAKRYDYDFSNLLISNQKTNAYLKEIQTLCDIDHNLHFHASRKYYCATLLNRGVRVETVAKAVGHSNIKTTLKFYAEIKESTAVAEISKIF